MRTRTGLFGTGILLLVIGFYFTEIVDTPSQCSDPLDLEKMEECKDMTETRMDIITYSNFLSPYSLIKLKAEKEIKKIKNNRVRINIAKIPGVNTRQTLSLITKNLPNFRDLLSENREIFKKVFFID